MKIMLTITALCLALNFSTSNGFAASVFTFRIQEDLGTLDWNQGEVPPLVILQIMEGLTTSNDKGAARPGLAQSWKRTGSAKGKPIWEFQIRKDARWSDGRPVCAQQFVDSWTRMLSSQLASPYAHYLFFVKNAESFHKGESPAASLGLSAKGCQTLQVELESPVGYFPQITSHWVTFPIRKELIEAHPKDWFEPKHLVVTGPYTLKEWKRNQSFAFQSNPHYWDKKPRHTPFTQLKGLVIADDQTALNLFREGKLHWMKDLPLAERPQLATLPGHRADPALVGYFLGFDVRKPPFNDPNVRCALAHSLDKSQIPRILGGGEVPAWNWIPPVLLPPQGAALDSNFNASEAKALLKKSVLNNQGAITLEYYIKDIHTTVMQWAQAQWQKNLGLKVELKPMEGKTYWGHLANDPPGFFLSGTTAWFSHPYAFLSEIGAASHANWGHYDSTEYNRLIESLKIQESPRSPALKAAQSVLLEKDCAIIPLYFRSNLSLTSPQCKPLHMNPLTTVYFKTARCDGL